MLVSFANSSARSNKCYMRIITGVIFVIRLAEHCASQWEPGQGHRGLHCFIPCLAAPHHVSLPPQYRRLALIEPISNIENCTFIFIENLYHLSKNRKEVGGLSVHSALITFHLEQLTQNVCQLQPLQDGNEFQTSYFI